MEKIDPNTLELEERVVHINRVAKVVKGGRRFKLSALVVVGDGQGHVGFGYGKGKEVPVAIQKGVQEAKKNRFKVPRSGSSIPHQTIGRFGAGRVLVKPASKGTGLIAGGPVRALLELAGVHDILTKSMGSANPINVIRATVAGLKSLKTPEDVAALRGRSVAEILDYEPRKEKPEAAAEKPEVKAAEKNPACKADEKKPAAKVAEKKPAAKKAAEKPAAKAAEKKAAEKKPADKPAETKTKAKESE